MKRLFISLAVLTILALAIAPSAQAKKLVLNPTKIATMTSPTESRDERVLIYFELPEKFELTKTQIDYAKLVFDAQVTYASMGQIEVYPMATSWKNNISLDWKSSWEKEGGDFSKDHAGKHITLKSADGEKSVRCDVTYIVLTWLDGTISNHGFILVPSQLDLKNSDVEYSIDTKGIQLVINYSLD